jgi:hypothetical protein
MASFIGRLQNILVSKLFAVVLISLLLSCLSIFPIANASAQTCGWNWDILSISGIKTNYHSGETISGNISFRLNNAANSSPIQQILIGIIDLENKVIDVNCVYNGVPKECPAWTTGTASFSLKTPVIPGNYKVIAADDFETSCSAALNRFPSLCSSTSPYCKDITTITISAGRTEIAPPIPTSPTSPPPTPPSQPDTGKKNGTVGTPDTTKPSGGIAPIALNKNTIIIISFVAALVILTLFASRKKGSKHFTKSILLLVLISFIGYLFWVYAIPLIADWFRHNLGTIITLVALAIVAMVVWRFRRHWTKIKLYIQKIFYRYGEYPSKEDLIKMGGTGFECYVEKLLTKQGWTVKQLGGPGDRGIDLIAEKTEKLYGKTEMYIQCKNHGTPSTGEHVRNLNGALPHNKAGVKGVLICPSGFTQQAKDEANDHKIELWDYQYICDLIKSSES